MPKFKIGVEYQTQTTIWIRTCDLLIVGQTCDHLAIPSNIFVSYFCPPLRASQPFGPSLTGSTLIGLQCEVHLKCSSRILHLLQCQSFILYRRGRFGSHFMSTFPPPPPFFDTRFDYESLFSKPVSRSLRRAALLSFMAQTHNPPSQVSHKIKVLGGLGKRTCLRFTSRLNI